MPKIIKVVTVGDKIDTKSGALKTSTLLKLIGQDPAPGERPVVFDNWTIPWKCQNEDYTIQLWDSSGQEDYNQVRLLSYPKANVILFLYSIDDDATLQSLKERWLPEIEKHLPNVGKVFLNISQQHEKVDEEYRQQAHTKFQQIMGEQYANQHMTITFDDISNNITLIYSFIIQNAAEVPTLSDNNEASNNSGPSNVNEGHSSSSLQQEFEQAFVYGQALVNDFWHLFSAPAETAPPTKDNPIAGPSHGPGPSGR